jgi:hypothetical protein
MAYLTPEREDCRHGCTAGGDQVFDGHQLTGAIEVIRRYPLSPCILTSRSIRDDTSLLIRLVNDQAQQSKHIHDDSISAVQSLKHDLLTMIQQYRDSTLQSHVASLRTIGDQLAKVAQGSRSLEKSERILASLYCEEVHSRELRVSDPTKYTFDWAFDSWCSGYRLHCGCTCTGSIDAASDIRCDRHRGNPQPPCTGFGSH